MPRTYKVRSGRSTFAAILSALVLLTGGCGSDSRDALTLYSGRSKSLVQPVVDRFAQATGIKVDVRYGDTAELTVALMEEGSRSRADLFWAQDAGALGASVDAGLLTELPDSLLDRLAPPFRSATGRWVATSGRARTIAYSSDRVDPTDVPSSVFDLTDPSFAGRVGWAPSNGSFQAFVTAMRNVHGEDKTRSWLSALRDNDAVAYPKNTAIIQGIANGEVDFGLPNHYYLFRFKAEDANFPVEQSRFEAGDIGNLTNVAGIGVIAGTASLEEALVFVDYVLGSKTQEYFATETYEYPVTQSVTSASLPSDSLLPTVDLDRLRDLDATLDMLREVGLL